MKGRQGEIIHLLVKNEDKIVTINEIAKTLNCSEKTVRNDFKQIDEWLQKEFQAKIIRKPNIGVKIDISADEKKRFLSLHSNGQTNQSGQLYDQERKENILGMLMENKTLSIQDLSESFYVSKHVIKQDLKEIETWLESFNLSIESRQKVGITLHGNEKNKRAALLRLDHFGNKKEASTFHKKWFSSYDTVTAKRQFEKIEKELGKEFAKETVNNLVFHLLITVKRIKEKQIIDISVNEVESLKTKKEYEIVKRNLKELERLFVVKFPEEEISYILLHILSSKEKRNVPLNENDLSPQVYSFLTQMIQKTSEHTNIPHEKDEHLFEGLGVHMQLVFKRIEHGLYHKNPLLHDIKKTYPYTFDALFHVTKELKELVGFAFPEDEIAYLTMHFEASKERLKKIDGKNKKVIVVCSMGIGMSQLLMTKLERKFHSLDITRCVSLDELEEVIAEENPDFIISTLSIEETSLPVITVSPLLPKEEEEKVKSFISNLGKTQSSSFSTLKKLIDKDLILFKEEAETPDEIIQLLCGLLKEKGYVNEEYVNDSIEREKLAPTTIGSEIAIPHGHPKNVLKQGIAMAILKKPILWKHQMVSVVFMLSIKDTQSEDIKHLFEEIILLGEEESIVEEWKKKTSKNDFYENM